MSDEAQLEGYGYMGLEKETTPGTDPGMDWDGDTNVASSTIPINRDAEIFKIGPREMVDFAALSGKAPGTKQIPGRPEFVMPGFEMPMFPLTVSASTSKPLGWQALSLLGFGDPTYNAGPPKTQTFTLQDYNHHTCSAHRYTLDESGGASGTRLWLYKLHGLKGNGGFRWDRDTMLTLFCSEARGHKGSRAGAAALPASPLFRDTEGSFRYPLVPWSAAITTFEDEDTNAYSGEVIAGEININHELTEKAGVDANGEGAGIIAVAQRRTGSLTIYQVPNGDWDPVTYWEDRKWLEFSITFTAPDVATDTVNFNYYFQITNVTPGFTDGLAHWELELGGVWEDDGTDAGRTPSDWLNIVYSSS